MAYRELNRRDFLSTSALASAAMIASGSILLVACSETSELPEALARAVHKAETLLRFARHLYPHDNVSDEVFAEIVSQMMLATGSMSPQSIGNGVDALDEAREKPWLSLDPADQVAVMNEHETRPYFAALQAPIRDKFYNHPAVWEAIGYDGPSAHLGGYLDRGFDDIDWLPEAD